MTFPAPVPADMWAEIRAVLQTNGREDLLAWLDYEARPRQLHKPIVVVAGETKRGKSSLINALLATEALVPSGLEAVTNVSLHLRWGESPGAVVHLREGHAVPIGTAEIAEWATEAGNPENERQVSFLEVVAPAALLRHIDLIDTPGTGGLNSAHGEITMSALAQADALLFVIDGGNPITAPELEFLTRAAQRVEFVAVAVTKTDRYPDWRTVLRDSARVVAQTVPDLARARFIPISSLLALKGIKSPALRAHSNVDEYEDFVTRTLVPSAEILFRANLLRYSASALDAVDQSLRSQLSLDVSADARQALQAEEEAFQRFNSSGAWRTLLDDGLRDAAHARADDISSTFAELRARLTEEVKQDAARDQEAFRDKVCAEILRTAETLREKGQQQIQEVIERALGVSVDLTGKAVLPPPNPDRWDVRLPGHRKILLGDNLTGLQQASFGGTILTQSLGPRIASMFSAHAARGMQLGGPPGAAVGVVLGGLYAVIMRKHTKVLTMQGEMRSWIATSTSEAARWLQIDFDRAAPAIRAELFNIMATHLDARSAEFRAVVAAREEYLQRSIAEQEARLSSIRDQRRRIGFLASALDDELQRCRELATQHPESSGQQAAETSIDTPTAAGIAEGTTLADPVRHE